jgi:HK97 gp10 family phage protein
MADDLDAYLDGLTDKVREKLSGAIRAEAQGLSDAQRAALQALEQEPDDSGDLVDSCQVVDGENDLEFIVQAGGEATTKEVRGGSGVPYDYAEAFEYGTSRQPARPFFWPTYRERREQIEENIADAVSEALE